MDSGSGRNADSDDAITLFLSGDVMTGRGIDQVLPHPGSPRIREPYMMSAQDYVALAERRNGPVPRPVDFGYVWGDALEALERAQPDLRLINLETSVTKSEDRADKGINYRMSPDNIDCLRAAKIDCCSLANNHVLDWGRGGLLETLATLEQAGIRSAGAGRNAKEAAAPAIFDLGGQRRVVVFSYGAVTSGIPRNWAAGRATPGISLLSDLSPKTVGRLGEQMDVFRRPGNVIVASIHWGDNWGYEIPVAQKEFARGLIDRAGVNIVHGHSSHHVKGIEVYKGRPIFYGCGDFFDDYEGITGQGAFRDDLVLMYFPVVSPADGMLVRCDMVPLRIRNFRLNRAAESEARWLREVLNREGRRFGTRAEPAGEQRLALSWR